MKSMKKSMKSSGVMKAKRSSMKTKSSGMKRKAMKVSKIARGKMAKSQVFKGRKEKTVGGNTKADLKLNKHGKVVSKKNSANGAKRVWPRAVVAARKALGVKGWCSVGGKNPKGQQLLQKARSIYKTMKK